MTGTQTKLSDFEGKHDTEEDELNIEQPPEKSSRVGEAYMPYNGPAYNPQKDDLHGI